MSEPRLQTVADQDRRLIEITVDGWAMSAMEGDTSWSRSWPSADICAMQRRRADECRLLPDGGVPGLLDLAG